ncbi:Forkhead associated (FHA) domain, binds pSer, pThr, pTyr [Kytococcus aerolatus]|uniref:Forkhead associated (FHA) domain, binds pSer, pThr, pTyr n=1 Tax=Kytococcus aerolatus TaxID=592308 RepID=A0A212TH31_9MICO|nr:DUF3662 and FHA domain-containing protein [Kytococcus aerolatus]SNC65126.1 Forkhead associated (FHA) domain, binds pSer, pThr, pTyr [Kytococcus aerolatus]
MGMLDRFEAGTERAFTAPFARLFRKERLQPVEIGSAIRKAMDSRAAVVNRHRTIVPNVFTVELSDDDFDRLISYDEAITDALIADAQEYVTQQRYTPGGPLQIELVADPELNPGVYKLHHATVRNPATLEERGDIDTWDASHERFDDVIDRHTSGQRLPTDARYLGEVDEQAIAEAQAAPAEQTAPEAGEEIVAAPVSTRQQRKEEKAARKEAERAEREAREREEAERREQEARERAEQQEAQRREQAAQERAEQEAQRQAQEEAQRSEAEARVDHPVQAPAAPAAAAASTPADGDSTPDTGPAATVPAARSTRSVARPWLEIEGARHRLEQDTTTLGRDVGCDITLADPGTSRRHAEITVSADGSDVSLRDLGSTNGTYLDGQLVRNARLADGDVVVMGRTRVTVHLDAP